MKQLILGLAACALIMSSCTQQEITENVTDGQGQLSFSTGLGKQSARAAELTNSALQGAAEKNGITLHAYQSNPEADPDPTWSRWFVDEVIYNPSWKLKNSTRFRNTNDTKYITYFSTVAGALTVNPDDFKNADFTSGKFPKFSYTVATNTHQEDLIAGITEIAANQTDITLGMRHILSQINFGTVGYDGANISIRNIEIKGLYNSATFTYKAQDTYPIGDWSDRGTDGNTTIRNKSYEYLNYSNLATKTHTTVPEDAIRGDIYIFGDGGNRGPGKTDHTYYPVGTNGAWAKGDDAATANVKINNSLILMPQKFAGEKDPRVTFEYQITDTDNAYVAGGPNTEDWEKGEFKLDFTTGADLGTHYMAQWDPNFRYVYLIDFTDFLDGIALTFTVNVEMYPWENYNKDDDNDGIVDIMAAGQPSAINMNKIIENAEWYIATQSETKPTTPPSTTKTDWVQVIRNETWDLSTYNFTQIEKGEIFILNFEHVIFNTLENVPTKITLTLPTGYKATANSGNNITMTGDTPTYTISLGDKTNAAFITITNPNEEYSTQSKLQTAIKAVTASGNSSILYKGSQIIDLKTMEPALTTINTTTVKFNRIVPTVGATTNGVWTWDATTRIATWTRWNDLEAAKTAFKVAAANATINCSDRDPIDLSAIFGQPNTTANSPVSILFSTAAVRTPGVATTNGTWSYNASTRTATWTKKP